MGLKLLSRSDEGALKAFLDESSEFKGILSFEGILRIDGRLDGEIITKGTLIVGEAAEVNADITASSVIAMGRIVGNVSASKRVEIHSKSTLLGNIKTETLVIQEGAVFEGRCEMGSDREKMAPLIAEDLEKHNILANIATWVKSD